MPGIAISIPKWSYFNNSYAWIMQIRDTFQSQNGLILTNYRKKRKGEKK